MHSVGESAASARIRTLMTDLMTDGELLTIRSFCFNMSFVSFVNRLYSSLSCPAILYGDSLIAMHGDHLALFERRLG